MASESRTSPYNQTVIGDCGHVVSAWPQRTKLGGSNARFVCRDCTIQEYGYNPDLEVREEMVWVTERVKPKKKAAPRKATPKKKTRPKSAFLDLLEQEGLFK